MARIKVGSNPYKGKASFITRCYMKWKRIELWWRRWRDPEIRAEINKQSERANPFHPANRPRKFK